MGERALLVCSGGGHLTEATHLPESLGNVDEIYWVTPDTSQSRTLLPDASI